MIDPIARACRWGGCTSDQILARDLCGRHYQQLRAHGDPYRGVVVPPRKSAEERFLARRQPPDARGCMLWAPPVDESTGYGELGVDGGSQYAHRFAWARAYGPIPEGALVDHECRVRACVNEAHLRLVSSAGNAQNRGAEGRGASGARGVHKTRSGRWAARVMVNRKSCHLGTFETVDEAALAAAQGRRVLMPYSIEIAPSSSKEN